jgi:ATP-binding cassette, subfamily C, bacterial CydC
MIRRLLSHISTHKGQFILALALATATILAGIGLMTTSGYLISRAAQRPMIVDLFMVTAGVRFFGISRAVFRYFERLVSHDLTFKILYGMRSSLYRRFDTFSQQWLMGRRPGDLLQGVVSDIEVLQNVYLRIIAPVITAVVISLLTFAGLALFDLRLAVTTLAFLTINGVAVPWLVARLARGRGKRDSDTRTAQKVFLVDRIQGMQDVLWMGQKTQTKATFDHMQEQLDDIQRRNAGTTGIAEGLNTLVAHMAMFAVLVLAIPLVLSGQIAGVWLAALTLGVLSSFEATQGLANAFIQYETSAAAATRLQQMAETKKQPAGNAAPPDGIQPETLPEIRFEKVCFSYDREQVTLEDISFAILPGSKTAIVGPTGSGKSTLVNLLLGFWQPDSGSIMAGNHPLQHLDLEAFRSRCGVVAQDAFIFNRSLRENLLLAKPEASNRELKDALLQAGLGSFAENLEMEPGSQGMRFSGGERQLLALARVLLKDPQLWIFDEPTAHMDADTERNTLDTIWTLAGNRSLLMITHRMLDMEKMDQILVMQQGRIAERGTHKILMKKNGLYARMINQQKQVLRE